jgi:hypothetical protein
VAVELGVYGLPAGIVAAALCFGIRMVGVHFGLDAPRPRAAPAPPGDEESPPGGTR